MATINQDVVNKESAVIQDDYIEEYRKFYEKYANIGQSQDQLPVKVVGCISFTENEIPGEILSYTLQYLDSIDCPPGLVTHICREVLEDTRKTLQNDISKHSSLSLMKAAVSSVHHCLQAGLDNEKACRLAKPPEAPKSAASASRNGLRCMEDRHVILDDLNGLLDSQDSEPSSFYAVYDGHSGPLAAAYSAAQLHMHFINSEYYKTNPQQAMREAFIKTDSQFETKKSTGGTTAVCCYLRGNNLTVGWVGDSQALLVSDGCLIQLVNPHKPSREDEHTRIVQLGGQVVYSGIWRVNGILAVSRAIGDTMMKPYVISEPEFASVKLSGYEEFLVLACDGLWDYVSEDDVVLEVYKAIEKYPDDIRKISDHLVKVAKEKRSLDNISVIVVFLQDINKLAEKAKWLLKKFTTMDASFDTTGGAQTNRFHVGSNQESPFSKEGLTFDLESGFKKQNGDNSELVVDPFTRPTNGKGSSDHFEDDMDEEDDDDLGPETDVDAVDDIVMSPSLAAARALSQGSSGGCNEVVDLLDGMGAQRHETPTPPVDPEADADYGGSALVENVGESGGEDSDEDEWNYIKGDKKDRGNTEESSLIPAEDNPENHTETFPDNRDDIMSSPLNPDAPPFVPLSPTGSVEGAHLPQRLLLDEVVAQSPQKPVPMEDIKMPEPQEFQEEISHRLADLGRDDYHNGHSDNSAMSSQENLKETLQGNEKQLAGLSLGDGDHIELQLNVTNDAVVDQAEFDRVQKDTTDFCDIQVAYNQQSTPYEEEGLDEELYERLKNKERDPMSMSFYQEKDLDTCEEGHNPFDLNAVQTIPNDIEEFCNDKPQAENVLESDISNPFLDNLQSSDVTQHEIHAAISDLDNAVTNESDSMDSILKAPSPLMFEKSNIEIPEVKELSSPISDNVSQLTEPSEQDIGEQQNLLNHEEQDAAVISHDSAFSADAPSPVPSPMESEIEQCENTVQHEVFEKPLIHPEPADFFSQSPPLEEKCIELEEKISQEVTNPCMEEISHNLIESHDQYSQELEQMEKTEQHFENLISQDEPLGQVLETATEQLIDNCYQNSFDALNQSSNITDLSFEPTPVPHNEHKSCIEESSDQMLETHNNFVDNITASDFERADLIMDSQNEVSGDIPVTNLDLMDDNMEPNVTIETSQSNTDFKQDIQEIVEKVEATVVEHFESEQPPQPLEIEPSQEEKILDIVQQVEESKDEPKQSDSILPVASAVAGAVAAVIGTVIAEDKKTTEIKPKSANAVKKPTASKPLTSPTKTTAPKTTAAPTKKPTSAPPKPSATRTALTATSKPAAAKPKTAPSPITKAPVTKTLAAAPKPKTTLGTKATTPTTEKKPLTNGDVKKEPIKKAAPLSKPTALKASVPKTTTLPSKTSPTSSPKTTATAPRAPITKAPAPRPATAPAAPKPKPAPISRAPLGSKPASAVSKTTTLEKSVKETTNKQLSGRPTPAPRTGLTSKPETKVSAKTTTKTTTTTASTKPLPTKRPLSGSATKTTTTTKTNNSKNSTVTVKTTIKNVMLEKVNGTVEKCVEEISETNEIILNGTDIPLKDNSPQQVDNSLLPIIDAAAD